LLFMIAFEIVAFGGSLKESKANSDEDTPDLTMLMKKPPVIALMVVLAILVLPIAAIEPTLEPYLSAPPFNLSVIQVGLVLLLISCTDVFGAAIAAPVAGFIGQIPVLYCSCCLLILSCFLLAFGPQTWIAVQLSFVPMSLAQLPATVMAPAVLMRICRTYGLDREKYTEAMMSIVMGTVTAVLGLFALITGICVDLLSFRTWFVVLGGVVCVSPFVLSWGFNEKVMGMKLAPQADAETDAAEAKQKSAKVAKDGKGKEKASA